MRTLLRPRLSSLNVFASALLVALGVKFQAGCGTDVNTSGDYPSGGGGGEGGSGAGPGTGGNGSGGNGSSTGTGGASSSSTGSGGGGGGAPATGCVNPIPIIVSGVDTGIDQCAGGEYRRRQAVTCPTNYPDTNPCCGTCPDGMICNTSGEVACMCVAACTDDSQCAANELCMCGQSAGVCISAKCKTGADCAPGEECTSWDTTLGCLYLEFACTTPADTCGGDNDCNQAPNAFCAVQPDGHRECSPGGCVIGRPFLVEDEARTAPATKRADWADDRVTPSLEGLDKATREELAAAWAQVARMEHASVAAFARFSLQLLVLGAPPDLVERTNQAMVDETRHARAAFALASAYRGEGIGPGSLPIGGALDGGDDITSILRLVIREGCIGETVAAVEAGEAEDHAVDPAVRGVLSMIANDESEHAELAWRTVRWALAAFGEEVRVAVLKEIALIEAEAELRGAPSADRSARDEALLQHGIVTSEVRAPMRRAVLRRAVLPCLNALLEEALPKVA
ncbi:MAG TPA: ferritin-like domain-containing protein [Polyangiaceae bacterium]|nr:ferritin-like domain-containing protein [Polyangiaceae bacterium]